MGPIARTLASSLAIVVAFLAGCASTPDVTQARSSWQGATYDDVVLLWGAPSRSTTLSDGRQAHTWVSERHTSRGTFYPSVGIFGGSGNVGVGVGVGTSVPFGAEREGCQRTLVFDQGRVVEQNWIGPDAFCETFYRP